MQLLSKPLVGASVATLITLALVLPLIAQDREAPEEWTRERAATSFEKSCASCHTMPDPAVHTDQLWLGQVMRTS